MDKYKYFMESYRIIWIVLTILDKVYLGNSGFQVDQFIISIFTIFSNFKSKYINILDSIFRSV